MTKTFRERLKKILEYEFLVAVRTAPALDRTILRIEQLLRPKSNDHRCIRGFAWILNPEEGDAYLQRPVRVGDPEPDNRYEYASDWIYGFKFCPECGSKVETPENTHRWFNNEEGE